MNVLSAFVGTFACTAIVSSAQATLISTNSQTVWSLLVSSDGWQVATETFSGVADGYYDVSYSGSVGGLNWTGSAAGGIYAQGGLFSTINPETLDFTFSPGVQGVGGNIFGTDVSGSVQITLADGNTYQVLFSAILDGFFGFYSIGAAIASMSIQTTDEGAGVHTIVDNLYFTAVPAPNSLALLWVAGLGSAKRRRR